MDGESFYSTNLNDIPYYDDTIYNGISISLADDGGFNGIISSKTLITPSNNINDSIIKSVSMPSRYDDYNITIKNANIKPTTHNTMLYPLLVNEDNPITGTLDYTNYTGEHLSWSFAYTDEEYVDVTTDNDLSNVEYFYNLAVESDLNVDTLVNILNTLPHVNSEVLNIGSTNLAKLTEDQIAIAINKGWTVV